MTTGTNNITEVPQENATKVLWENSGYIVLALIMVGQALSVVNVLAGQLCYLACNVLALVRCFALVRPPADKVKDAMCLGLTVSILLIKFVL